MTINEAFKCTATSCVRKKHWTSEKWLRFDGISFRTQSGNSLHLQPLEVLSEDWEPYTQAVFCCERCRSDIYALWKWRAGKKFCLDCDEKEAEKEKKAAAEKELSERAYRLLARDTRPIHVVVGTIIEKYERLLEWAKSCPIPSYCDPINFDRGNWINRGMTLLKELEEK